MHRRSLSKATVALTALTLAFAIGSCSPDEGDRAEEPTTTPPISPVEQPTSTASPTPPALPEEPPLTSGQVSVDCVEGWVTPEEGSARFREVLGLIRRATGIDGPLVVVDMRYFEGPESPPAPDKGYLLVVERWYVKLYAERDLSFQGRFLVESRRFGRGTAAVAPYDTAGFRSPDWIGFQYESADPGLRYYEGLPGTWSGTAYDFVQGGAGLRFPGLPEDVVGCLDAS
ncbi:MAG: hypothetical protein WD834_01155 [Actinomycetota bacterium]